MDTLFLRCLGSFTRVEGQDSVIDSVLQCFVENTVDVTNLRVTDRYPSQVRIERVKYRPVERVQTAFSQRRQDVPDYDLVING